MVTMNRLKNLAVWGSMLAAFGAAPVHAGDTAQINVTASVIVRTCTPDWGASPQEVPLGTVDGSGKKGQDNIASKDFSLHLKNCTGVKNVEVTATGSADSQDNKAFQNAATDSPAEGVAVYLTGGSDNARLVPNSNTGVNYPVSGGDVTMGFKAVLEGNGDNLTGGAVKVPVTLNVNYE